MFCKATIKLENTILPTLKQQLVSSPSQMVRGRGNFLLTRYFPTAPRGRPLCLSASMQWALSQSCCMSGWLQGEKWKPSSRVQRSMKRPWLKATAAFAFSTLSSSPGEGEEEREGGGRVWRKPARRSMRPLCRRTSHRQATCSPVKIIAVGRGSQKVLKLSLCED